MNEGMDVVKSHALMQKCLKMYENIHIKMGVNSHVNVKVIISPNIVMFKVRSLKEYMCFIGLFSTEGR